MTKILDMIPDAIDKFSSRKDEKMTEQDVADILDGESRKYNVTVIADSIQT